MRKNSKNFVLSIIFIVLISTSCHTIGSDETTIEGYVRTTDGKPIDNATVRFGTALNSNTTMTYENGFYKITAKHGAVQTVYLSVEKEGYSKAIEKFPGIAIPEKKDFELLAVIPHRRKFQD